MIMIISVALPYNAIILMYLMITKSIFFHHLSLYVHYHLSSYLILSTQGVSSASTSGKSKARGTKFNRPGKDARTQKKAASATK
jgi:hypothetical protein